MVEIPHQRCFSADGELFEGVGIPPTKDVADSMAMTTVLTTESKANDQSVDVCVKKAIEHITNV